MNPHIDRDNLLFNALEHTETPEEQNPLEPIRI
jgi:hypothetical protein